ncbi:hypothetical protein ABEB36_008656 [Hypothenemus hampei]|uniref:Gamma-tubulin complex component 6 n=1 Tax=Hypothenemus hampei TaxID=57062 RepID=A0ABD1ERN9_HYPHA
MEEVTDSVHYLITSLCECYLTTNSERIKLARSKCYEKLLGKKQITDPRNHKDLEGSRDATINLLAWCFKLKRNFNFSDIADALQMNVDHLKLCYNDDIDSFNNILTFLLCLKDVPKKSDNKLDLSTLPEIEDGMSKFHSLFQLPIYHEHPVRTSQSTDMFKLSYKTVQKVSSKTKSELLSSTEALKDEGYSSPHKDNIWDIVVKMPLPLRRNWESYGCGPPEKEKPFLSELGELSSLWMENLESLYQANNLIPSFTIINNKIKSRKVFIQELKYLLMGIPSETFNLSTKEQFFMSPGIMVEGITPDALEWYCNSFLLSGTCYRALNQIATKNENTRKFQHHGYVFTEFCQSLARYLQFYRTAVISVPDDINFLSFHNKINEIQKQISVLASICKVGPYASKNDKTPHGVALINYLYQKVIELNDEKLSLVLYSLLFPCCQIYFSRFLHQWLIKGTLNDPYGEFFISPNLKYMATRGRTYWTRSYNILTDKIPDFLNDLKDDILFCGQIMNLLRLCNPMNALSVYLMGDNPLLFSCCLTHDKLMELEHNASLYYLKVSTECGLKFQFAHHLEKSQQIDIAFQRLIAKKRIATLKRIELERQKTNHLKQEKRLEELLMLKEQYESALEQKQLKIYKEIEREIKIMEDNLKIDEMREKLIKEEAVLMIDYYSELCRVAEMRKEKINNHISYTKNIQIDSVVKDQSQLKENITEEKGSSSCESFYSAPEDNPQNSLSEDEATLSNNDVQSIGNSVAMDILNANFEEEKPVSSENKAPSLETKPVTKPVNKEIQQAIENFELARKIKHKILNQELGITTQNFDLEPKRTVTENNILPNNLSAAQRNKLKVLSSEFGINVIKEHETKHAVLTTAQINRNKVLGHDSCFLPNYESHKHLDNASFVNKNVGVVPLKNLENVDLKGSIKKSRSLQLDFDKLSIKSDSEKLAAMSVDSTPTTSDIPQLSTPLTDIPSCTTPSSIALSTDMKLDSFPTTAETLQTEDQFSATFKSSNLDSFYQKMQPIHLVVPFSKRVTLSETKGVSRNSLMLLHESVAIPLQTQLKLANNEILKYFIEDLNYLNHLRSLRDYFFLQDGEFGRNITENLFEKLYNANFPVELINFRTLQHLVFNALDNSTRLQENSKYLSFKINNQPKCFDLGDPDVLECLSLTYKVNWPLNILLPSDTIAKYDEMFKFLLKINRVSWVLKKIFLELKILAKETGKKEIYLMSSPQYRRLHQCRHVMSHFMQTLQNYIVGEVLQLSWANFEKNLLRVTNIDELYIAHTTYVKDILFRCMLNQKSIALKKVIHKILVVILKFYDYLRTQCWKCEGGTYIHPNFIKLDKIFKNFEEFIFYFYKLVNKVSKSGYYPHLVQFLEVLDVNGYYSTKLESCS